MKKKKWKKVWIGICIVFMLTGCGNYQENKVEYVRKEEDFFNRQKEMEQYLICKYGNLSYEVTGVIWRFWNQRYDQMNLSIEKNGHKEMCWVRRYERDGTVSFTESYFGLQIREEYEKRMKEKADTIFNHVKVFSFTENTEFSENVDRYDGLEEAREKGEKIRVISWMFVSGIRKDQLGTLTRRFYEAWKKEQMESLVSVFLVDEEEFFQISRINAGIFIKERRYKAQDVCYVKDERGEL